jgi:RimJ/RimL family protein N-acetyltransferase
MYPAELETCFTAKNGQQFRFRPEKSSDTDMLWRMFSTLSDVTVSKLVPPFTWERVQGWTSRINYDELLTIVAVAEEKGVSRIVASASLKFNAPESLKHKGEFSVTVHHDYQELGIGTALLNCLLSIARNRGLKKIHLTVNVENTRAIHVYRKAGFEFEGTLHKEMYYKGKYFDEYRMALFL